MEGLKYASHQFNFGHCRATMGIFYDDRDGSIFVTDESLDAMKTLIGHAAARQLSTASVIVGGQHLNLLNGHRHEPEPVLVDDRGFQNLRAADKVISITRRGGQEGLVIPLTKVARS